MQWLDFAPDCSKVLLSAVDRLAAALAGAAAVNDASFALLAVVGLPLVVFVVVVVVGLPLVVFVVVVVVAAVAGKSDADAAPYQCACY